jgi:hypothetical protein
MRHSSESQSDERSIQPLPRLHRLRSMCNRIRADPIHGTAHAYGIRELLSGNQRPLDAPNSACSDIGIKKVYNVKYTQFHSTRRRRGPGNLPRNLPGNLQRKEGSSCQAIASTMRPLSASSPNLHTPCVCHESHHFFRFHARSAHMSRVAMIA